MTPERRSDDGSDAPVEAVRDALTEARRALQRAEEAAREVQSSGSDERPPSRQVVELTWRERLWQAPAECRIGVEELREALGVSESWVYNRTRESADPRLPHAKLGGALSFKVGEVRAWIRDHEESVVGYRMESAPGELRVEGRAS